MDKSTAKQSVLKKEKFKAELLAQANRFEHVFATDNGSLYFVSQDGASLRLEMAAAGNKKIQPITMKQILVDDDTAQKILANAHTPEKLIGQPLPKQSFEVGMRPVEIGIQGMPAIRYEETEHELTILGDDQGGNHSGVHVGHRITEIVR